MAPHSSTLACRIPWTQEPGGLQSMGSLSVGHDWATSLSLFTFMHWRRKWQPTPVFLPGKSMDRGAWWAAVHGVAKCRIRLSNFTFSFYFHALGKEMATHSSVLAWRIPETGEPGRLPSLRSLRVGHDWSDLAAVAAAAETNKAFNSARVKINIHYLDIYAVWESTRIIRWCDRGVR